jgi:hypothetical protein
MIRHAVVAAAVLGLAIPATAARNRTIEETLPSQGVASVVLDTGVGDVELLTHDTDTIEIEVLLIPRRGGLFSSLASAERAVERATLESRRQDDRLELRIDAEGSGDDRRFEERWTVTMPERLAVSLELGVGDLTVRGIAGGIVAELGVGDADIEVPAGDVSLELGVGDARVTAPATAYGTVDCSGGVGDSRIDVGGRKITGDGFLGHSASWLGDGPGTIEIEAGVGDARVVLE